jgi:predicted hydrolase (HD superfamily)
LGVPLEEHVEFCVKAMQARADELGLAGSSAASG